MRYYTIINHMRSITEITLTEIKEQLTETKTKKTEIITLNN